MAREIFSDVANKWAFLIIESLGERTLRFSELRDEIEGISHKMLTQNLRMLERNGLVERKVHPVVPPRVEYTLTRPGQALRATVDGMCAWTHQYPVTSRPPAAASAPDGWSTRARRHRPGLTRRFVGPLRARKPGPGGRGDGGEARRGGASALAARMCCPGGAYRVVRLVPVCGRGGLVPGPLRSRCGPEPACRTAPGAPRE